MVLLVLIIIAINSINYFFHIFKEFSIHFNLLLSILSVFCDDHASAVEPQLLLLNHIEHIH